MEIKDYIRFKINQGKKPDEKKLFDILKNYDIISFDLFDTLIKRNVEKPSDVFAIIEKYNFIPNFKQKRIKAEVLARKKCLGEEVTLEDIYNYYPNINNNEKKKLIEIEKKTECSISTINIPLYNVYKKLVGIGKQVYIITDTYYSESFLIKLLEKLGIKGCSAIFSSSTYNLSKRTGSLFDFFVQSKHIDNKRIVHIGDNIKSDYIIPKSKKINAIHIPTYYIYRKQDYIINDSLKFNYLNSFIRNHTFMHDNYSDYYYRFGYNKFGIALYEYVRWIYNKLIEKKIDKVYFFSRDGYIMKKAFDLINNNQKIKSYYLEVSRRSLRVPILWMNPEFDDIINELPATKKMSIKTFLFSLGLEKKDYISTLKNMNMDLEQEFDFYAISNNKKVRSLYNALKEKVIKNSKEEYKLLVEYLKSKDLKDKFAVVDIGWSGSMQRFLEQTLKKMNIPHNVYGYYIGIEKNCVKNLKINPNLNIEGFWFDLKNRKNDYDYRQSFVGLFEMLFLEQAGSVKKYRKESIVKAERLPYEYIKNGEATFELLSVRKIQEGALDFIKDIQNDYYIDKMKFSSIECFSGILKIGKQPTRKDLKMFGKFKFYDDENLNYLAYSKGLFYYLIHIKQIKRDFLDSRWKIGFLKWIFKINLPYEKIVSFMRKYK